MTDFLITQITLYPWFTWLLVFLAAMGAWFAAVWAYKIQLTVFAWLGYRRQAWLAKAAVRRQLLGNPRFDCATCRDREAMVLEAVAAGDDLDYCEHDVIARTCTRCGYDGLGEDWDALDREDWSPTLAWGPPPEMPAREFAGVADVIRLAREKGLLDDDQLPDGPPRCSNRDCYRYGEPHAGPCDVAPTQPAACYTDPGLETLALYTTGPAMPPQPVREYLHPAIMDDLSSAGFSEHETTDGAVDSMFTRAQAREVEAMVTDGIIPADEEGKA